MTQKMLKNSEAHACDRIQLGSQRTTDENLV